MSDSFANHDTSHSNYISIFPLFCLKPVKKWKVKYDWTAYFANNESFCTKPNNVGLTESIHFLDYIKMPTKINFSSNWSLRSNCIHLSVCDNVDFFIQAVFKQIFKYSKSIQKAFKEWLSFLSNPFQRVLKEYSKSSNIWVFKQHSKGKGLLRAK